MELDIGLIPDLLALAEEGHYGRAAARCHLTASGLSRRIQRLESQVGVTLVSRVPGREPRLTPAGVRFAAAAEPLLAQAAVACHEAREKRPCLVWLGFPAETNFQQHVDLAAVVHAVRLSYPELRVSCLGVPFSHLTSSLLEGRVDLLCTIAPVRHAAVESVPLPFTSPRIGVVGAHHDLADAGGVDAASFAEQPMLYNPDVPPEWMHPFWLGDVRPQRQARLVPIPAQDQGAVLRHTIEGRAVITTLATIGPLLGPRLRVVGLRGAPPLTFYLARRREDRRGAVGALVAALRALPQRELA